MKGVPLDDTRQSRREVFGKGGEFLVHHYNLTDEVAGTFDLFLQ